MTSTSIRSRLVLAVGLIILFFVAQGALVWWAQGRLQKEVVAETSANTRASAQLADLAVLAQQIRRYEKEYFVYVTNEERRNNYEKEWTGTFTKIEKALSTIQGNDSPFNAAEKGQAAKWGDAAAFYGNEMRKIFDAVKGRQVQMATPSAPVGTPTVSAKAAAASAAAPAFVMFTPIETNTMIGPGKDRFSGELIKGVSEMSKAKTAATLSLADGAKEAFGQLLMGVLATVALGVLIALGLMVFLPRLISKPLASLATAVDEMSKGALDKAIGDGGVAEFAGLGKSLDRMRVAQQALVARMQRR
jgi:methyl-accepting chemotaxis protein